MRAATVGPSNLGITLIGLNSGAIGAQLGEKGVRQRSAHDGYLVPDRRGTEGFLRHPDVPIVGKIAEPIDSAKKIIIRGADRQKVGQVASNIRGYRPPEPYKGKGVKYAGEQIRRKEAKKS